jgi:group I intron endonuclease
MVGIYKITSPSNKIYIGQSRNIEKRFKSYYRKLGKNQPRLYRSFKKYGIKQHIFEVLEECDFDQLNIRERYWQETYDVINENGLNCLYTEIDDKPRVINNETIKKLKENASKYWLGKKFTKEHCENMSISRKGKIGTPCSDKIKRQFSEQRKGENNPMYGKKGILNKCSKKVINTITGEIYNSLNECCIINNLNSKYMSRYLNGTRNNKTIFKYLINE